MIAKSFDSSLGRFHNIDQILGRFLPESSDSPLAESMRYASLHGGKRIRAKLVMRSSEIGPISSKSLVHRLAASVEFLHAYSLVLDDLPCMDDDSVRRGKPSCHRRFGEDIAILTANSLMSLAFEVVKDLTFPQHKMSPSRPIQILTSLTSHDSVPQGQCIDLNSEKYELSLEDIVEIYELKTGALLGASMQLGALTSGIDVSKAFELRKIGVRLGFAYQVLNDCHGIKKRKENLSCNKQSEESSDSLLFSKVPISSSIDMALETIENQRQSFDALPFCTDPLHFFTDYLESRLKSVSSDKLQRS